MKLLDDLCRLSKVVEAGSERWHERNESEIRRALVVPFIAALGYDTNNPREVKEEFPVGDGHVDYAIKHNWQPIIFIEAKPSNSKLSKHWKQLHDYFKEGQIELAILTNGLMYEFYTDLKVPGRMDMTAFLSFNLNMDFHFGDDEDKKLANDLQWLTKRSFDKERMRAVARRRAIVPILRQQMHGPPRELVWYFARQVTNSALTEPKQEQMYAEALSEAWRDLKKFDQSERRKLATDVVNVELTAEYKGRRFTATLLLTETLQRTGNNVVFEDVEMNYQEATNQAINMVHSSESFVSGWEFWRFIDPDTIEELPLKRMFSDAEMRTRIRNRKYRR